MFARLLAVSALFTLSLPLLACDDPVEADAEFRAIVVSDNWGLQDPWHAPDVNSCEDYWNDRCAGVSAAECDLLHQRYTCSSADSGVIITDHYADAAHVPAEKTWRTFTPGQAGFSDATATPAEACALVPKERRKACDRLATIAKAAPGLLANSPGGGLGVSGPVDAFEAVLASDLLGRTLEQTTWKVPALDAEGEAWIAEHVADDGVVIFVVPDGTIGVSSKDIIVLRDVRCTMDKVEVCVDVDVK